MIDDMKLIEDVSILKKEKLILYGAAIKGERMSMLLKNMGIEQAYFCDSDGEKWGGRINNVEIISPVQLEELARVCNVVVIITTQSVDELVTVLEKMGIKNIYTIFAVEYSLLLNLKPGVFTDEQIKWFQWKRACYGARERESYFTKAFITCTETIREEENPILVYQSGKTGSSTVWKSICQYRPAAHMHALSQERIEKISGSNLVFNKSLKYLYKCVQEEIGKKNIKIITLVRDPIAQMISRFFHVLGSGEWATQDVPFKYCFDKELNNLYKVFEYYILDSINSKTQEQLNYGFEFDWFDKELKNVFGIDIYETAFNKSEGYRIIRHGNVQVLCMQLEKLNQLKGVMSEFLEIPDMQIVTTNRGEESVYKYVYGSFRKQVKIPVDVLDFYYNNNEAMKHFYNDEDIRKFREQWEKQCC